MSDSQPRRFYMNVDSALCVLFLVGSGQYSVFLCQNSDSTENSRGSVWIGEICCQGNWYWVREVPDVRFPSLTDCLKALVTARRREVCKMRPVSQMV